MEIDSTPVPPPQEYSDCVRTIQSESMNCEYPGLSENTSDAVMDSTSSSYNNASTMRHFGNVDEASGTGGGASASAGSSYGHVDDSKVVDRPLDSGERFVNVLDQLDAQVEKFRKEAFGLQEKKDFLVTSIDLIKSNETFLTISESEREEINCYIQRLNARLATVELNVRTVRDNSQQESLSQINAFIDMMITMGDPVLSRQRCQQFLNACCSSAEADSYVTSYCDYEISTPSETDLGPIDKKFENVLLGCTLDDQKMIKRRLQALKGYLNRQIIHN